MSFIDGIKERARKEIKTIVLPEADDLRVLKATEQIIKEEFAKIVLIGQKDKIQNLAKENNININGAKIVDPRTSEKHQEYVELLYNLRKHKGMTIEQAEKFVNDPVYFGTLMLKDTNSEADGLVSGAAHSTSDTLRPALQILKTAPVTKLVSAFFVMVVPDCEYGDNGTFIFGDSGLNENPDDEKLSEIAISSSRSFKQLVEKEPKVAMLSYSTMGSAKSELTQKVIEATKILKEKEPDYKYTDSDEYADYYKSVIEEPDLLSYSDKHIDNIGEEMILNDYEKFIKETYNIIVKENMMKDHEIFVKVS